MVNQTASFRLIPLLCLLLLTPGCLTEGSKTGSRREEAATRTVAKGNFSGRQREPLTRPSATLAPSDGVMGVSENTFGMQSNTTAKAGLLTSAATNATPAPGTIAPRVGDEIVVAGHFVHTGTPVVLWLDPGGYDAYRVERRFSPLNQATYESTQGTNGGFGPPNRYDERNARLTLEERERIRGGGWDLPTLQHTVNQIVMHYDVAGTSRQCFKVLHDTRNLSVHFMVDLDGTIYQTLDVKERARHASGVNDRSVGIEIANIGAYPAHATAPLAEWYRRDTNGQTRITLPARLGDGGLRTANFIARPARAEAITNTVQGEMLVQYDFTPEQYNALSHLVASLCAVLPEIKCEAPRDAGGNVPTEKLADEELESFQGVLGHYHITTRKLDPGPAFQWDKVIGDAQKLMNPNAPVPASSQ